MKLTKSIEYRGHETVKTIELIRFLKSGRRTLRDINRHMGWKGDKWNKTARRWLCAFESAHVPVNSMLMPEGRESIWWIERSWTL